MRSQPVRAATTDEMALALVTAAAGVGLGRLTTAPGSWRTVVPVVVAVVAGHAAVAGLGRRPLRWRSLGAGLAAVVLFCACWFAPGTTLWGLPTAATAGRLWHLLTVAGRLTTAGPTPVRAAPGVVLCVVAGAGATAVLARWLAGPRRGGAMSLAGALVPPTGLFCYTALLSSGVGRLWGAMVFLVAVAGFVLVAGGTPAPARRRLGPVVRAAATTGLALAVPLAASPALAGMKLDALPFARQGPATAGDGAAFAGAAPGSGGSGGAGAATAGPTAPTGSGTVAALSLVDDLGAVLSGDSGETVFTADSPVPTYWQVATLTRFDGRRFTADPVTRSAARLGRDQGPGAVPALPVPDTRQLFEAAVSVVGLRTNLLPVPPATMSVSGEEPIDLRSNVGATVPFPAGPGYSYVAVAGLPATVAGPGPGGPAPMASALAPYLALPPLGASVVRLARALVRGVAGPEAQAQAIAGWFRSSRFHYSLTRPAGGQSLDAFLFRTRTGFCQQFAAAFAIVARLDGLPTRLAVGFTAGLRRGAGPYVVTGADAHIWPEVYLGPSVGWASVEPTPAAGDGTPAVGVLQGIVPSAGRSALLGTLGEIRKSGGASSSTTPGSTPSSTPRSAPAHAGRGTGARRAGGLGHALRWPAVGLGAVVVLWVLRRRLAGGLAELPSRLRAPPVAVLASWRRAARELEHRRLGRAPQETMSEHAGRLVAGRPLIGRPYEELAALAVRACYAGEPLSPAEVRAARRLRAEVCAQARRRAGRPATPGAEAVGRVASLVRTVDHGPSGLG